MKRIQGTWTIHPAKYKDVGDKEAIEALIALSSAQWFMFDGDSVTFHSPPGDDQKGKFRLDSTKKPKQFDLSDQEKGIYELEGDTLKLCWDHEAKTNGRPTKFASDEDKDSVHYLVLKREKKAVAARPAAAEENEAEKLFRSMQQKIRTAKTLQIRFEAIITDAAAKKGTVKGTLILGEGDKLRVECEGKLFGEESKFSQVSDGTDMKSFGYTKAPGQPQKDLTENEKPPKGAGAFLRESLPRDGIFWAVFKLDRRGELPADLFKLSDFKLAGEEKIGERNTLVIQYTITVKEKGKDTDPNALSMTVWLDAKTNLPVRLAMTGGGSDITAITETYSEFTIHAKVDAKLFELPKGKDKAPPPPDDKADAKKIQGTWVVDPSTFKGVEDKEILKELLKEAESMRFTFAGDTFTIRHPPGPPPFEKGREEKGGFGLDPNKTPKQIDLTDSAQGIYELDGDTLKLCWDQRGKANGRPTKFAWDKDKDTVYFYVLKREKK